MPSRSHADPFPAVVSRLRSAGCVFAEDEARLLVEAAQTAGALEPMVARRVAGEPLEVILGWAEFCGLRIAVEAGVFVPRRRTQFLAETAAAAVAPGHVVVDLCCGTGAIGAAIAARVAGIEVHAVDIDPVAVRCARRNLAQHGGRVHAGDLFDALPAALRGRIDVLVVNAPYVPTGDIATLPREARDHEPAAALDGGPDGLDVHRRVAAGAPGWLAAHGRLLIETSDLQAPHTAAAVAAAGLTATVATGEAHEATVVTGAMPAG